MTITIGIVGGVASGKSRVAAALARLGAVVLNADAAGHEVLREPDVIAAIRQRFGESTINAAGEVDRKAVAAIVFAAGNESERLWLNQLSHPRIRARLKRQKHEAEQAGAPAVVVDAALLFESGWHELCDVVVFVDTSEPQRRRNAESRGWNEIEVAKREKTQLPLEEKRRRATHVLDNSGTLEELDAAVKRLWKEIGAR